MNDVQNYTEVDWEERAKTSEGKSFFVTNNNIYE